MHFIHISSTIYLYRWNVDIQWKNSNEKMPKWLYNSLLRGFMHLMDRKKDTNIIYVFNILFTIHVSDLLLKIRFQHIYQSCNISSIFIRKHMLSSMFCFWYYFMEWNLKKDDMVIFSSSSSAYFCHQLVYNNKNIKNPSKQWFDLSMKLISYIQW